VAFKKIVHPQTLIINNVGIHNLFCPDTTSAVITCGSLRGNTSTHLTLHPLDAKENIRVWVGGETQKSERENLKLSLHNLNIIININTSLVPENRRDTLTVSRCS